MTSAPYENVAVLLIKWAEELEEVKTTDQVRVLSDTDLE